MVDFTRYTDGWRLGMFHKCNGLDKRSWNGYEDDELFLDGYEDGFEENERKIYADFV